MYGSLQTVGIMGDIAVVEQGMMQCIGSPSTGGAVAVDVETFIGVALDEGTACLFPDVAKLGL